ncbi:transporter substrate-binding domain-containing protein [Acidaminobacter sp. JC074]|uniref:ATP-binding protein n=1 Tax=Acidaminobacter sp. JC074 TaxID=2530199 RepID=UPI001F0FB71B|nr:transporter substrate-binding domain-containing protein [Acidaminobacter sp. JC074]MCH4886033.1 transporter substrate-binding domain-containing protein [Acidaminobacter sp. JC074]
MKWFKCIIILLVVFMPITFADDLEFTDEELDFIEGHDTITLAVDPAFVPFEFVDSDGQYKGIANDYIQLIEENTGLKMEVVYGLTWPEAYQKALSGEIDILPCVSKNAEREKVLVFSEPYYKFQRVLVSNNHNKVDDIRDLFGKSVAVQRNSSHQGFISDYDQIQVNYYNTVDEALLAVSNGSEEAFIGNLASTSYLTSRLGISELNYSVIDSDGVNQLYFASVAENELLIAIINKGILRITEEQKIKIHHEWIGIQGEVDYSGVIRVIVVLVVLAGIIFSVSAYWILRLRNEIEKRKIIEEDLKQAKKDAEDAYEFKSSFLTRISHEIRTPLNAITGLSYLLKNTQLDKIQHSHVDRINHSSKMMLSIINDIQDITKLETDNITLIEESIKIEDIVRNILNIVSLKVDEKKLHFTFVKDPKLPNHFIGDGRRIEQVLLNIVDNAIKFTVEGDVSMAVSLVGYQHDMYDIQFVVKDTGIGMSEEQIEDLLEPFKQKDASITRAFGGTGLGLTLAKHILELMGGNLEVKSHLGQGTEIKVNFKLKLDEDADFESKKNFEYVKGIKTLVLNKDLNSLSLISDYLRSFSIDAEFTSSSAQFVQLIKSASSKRATAYHLVIVDEDSHEGNCLEMIEELQQYHVKTIVIKSALKEWQERDNIKVLAKPILPSVLHNTIVDLFHLNMFMNQEDEDYDLDKQHVLIVEDNKTNQLIAKSLLDTIGVKSDIAENGEIAVSKAKENFDLILMDLHMPIMNGYDATKKILDSNPNQRIIAMTADVVDGVQQKCLAYGMLDFISKPFEPEQFIKKIVKFLGEHSEKNASELIDYQKGIQMLGGNEDMYRQVIHLFLEENIETVKQLTEAAEKNNYEDIISIAHKVKGSSGSIGAEGVRQLASDLQKAAEQEEENEINLLKDHFVLQFEDLMIKLQEDYVS